MKNYQKVMAEIEKRLSAGISQQTSASGFMKKTNQKPQVGQKDVIDSLAGYIKTLRTTKEELMKNGSV